MNCNNPFLICYRDINQKRLKVIAKKTYPQLDGIFKEGDVLTFEPILYEKDTKLVNAIYMAVVDGKMYAITSPLANIRADVVKVAEPVYAKKGSYNGYTITNEEGNTYSDSTIRGAIGYVSAGELFEKVLV